MRGKAWPRQSELSAFYGSPHGRNGLSSPSWERENQMCIRDRYRRAKGLAEGK